jgi:tetratricopeptide (TPR) repeat protein
MLLKAGLSKSEIDQALQGKGDFVQIDMLGRFLKEPIVMDTKKFVFLKLATLYEKSRMYNEVAKMYNNAADISIPFAEKIKLHTKEAEFYVKTGAFDRVENAMKKAMAEANFREKEQIQNSVKQFVRDHAVLLEKELKRNQAINFYERLLQMRATDQEKIEIKTKLLELYKKTGKLHEALALEKGYGNQ